MKYKLKKQLYTAYVLAVIIPITILGSFLLIYTNGLLNNYYQDLLAADNLRTSTIISEITNLVYQFSDVITEDENLRKLLNNQYYITDNYYKVLSQIKVMEQNMHMDEVDSITIYTDNRHFFTDTYFVQVQRHDRWFDKAYNRGEAYWTTQKALEIDRTTEEKLCLVRRIELNNTHDRALMVYVLSTDYLASRIVSDKYDMQLAIDDEVFFTTEENCESLMEDLDQKETVEGIMDVDNISYMVDGEKLKLSNTESTLGICVLDSSAPKSIRRIIAFCVLTILIAVVLTGVFIMFFFETFTKRILILRSQNEQQAMEFKMLAAQINPHFLYNTLETIRMKAFSAGDKEVASAIKLLGKSMRYVLDNTGTEMTTLGEELRHVENYLKIQKLRFEDKFDSEITVEEGIELENIKVLPLLIQPIVENAFIHGIEEMENGGHIHIMVAADRKKKKYEVAVRDNGCGMDETTLSKLMQDIKNKDITKGKSIGLYNINQRLLLTYGQDYGLRIDSVEQGGTTVQFDIPMK